MFLFKFTKSKSTIKQIDELDKQIDKSVYEIQLD